MDSSTYIVTKNIVLEDLERIVQYEVFTNNLITSLQSVELKIKNSRVFVLLFPEGIEGGSLHRLASRLKDYKVNEVSVPEVVLVDNEIVMESTSDTIDLNIDSDLVIQHYKLNSGPLHTILKLKAAQQTANSWWHFWK